MTETCPHTLQVYMSCILEVVCWTELGISFLSLFVLNDGKLQQFCVWNFIFLCRTSLDSWSMLVISTYNYPLFWLGALTQER